MYDKLHEYQFKVGDLVRWTPEDESRIIQGLMGLIIGEESTDFGPLLKVRWVSNKYIGETLLTPDSLTLVTETREE